MERLNLEKISSLNFSVLVKMLPILFYAIGARVLLMNEYGELRETLFLSEFIGLIGLLGLNQVLYTKSLNEGELENGFIHSSIVIIIACTVLYSLYAIWTVFSTSILVHTISFSLYLLSTTYLSIKISTKNLVFIFVFGIMFLLLCLNAKSHEQLIYSRIFINMVFFVSALTSTNIKDFHLNMEAIINEFFEGVKLSIYPVIALISLKLDGLLFIYFFSESEWAIYSNALLEIPVLSVAILYIGGRHANLLSEAIRSENMVAMKRRLARMIESGIYLIIPFGIVAFTFGNELMALIFGSKYQLSGEYFRVYLLLVPGKIFLFSWILIPLRQYKFMFTRSIVDLCVNLLLGLALISLLGKYAFICSTILSFYLISVLSNVIRIKKVIGLNLYGGINWSTIGVNILPFTIVIVLVKLLFGGFESLYIGLALYVVMIWKTRKFWLVS